MPIFDGRPRPSQRMNNGAMTITGMPLSTIKNGSKILERIRCCGNTTPTSTPAQTTAPKKHTKHRAHHAPVVASTVKLQLVPTGAVYVCLIDGAGKRLIPGEIFNVGQTIPTKTSSKLLLTLGNASVRMKVNGVAVTVPSTGSPVGFDLTPRAHTMLPAGKQPQCA